MAKKKDIEVESKILDEPQFKEIFLTASYYNNVDPYAYVHYDRAAAERAIGEGLGDVIIVTKIPYRKPGTGAKKAKETTENEEAESPAEHKD